LLQFVSNGILRLGTTYLDFFTNKECIELFKNPGGNLIIQNSPHLYIFPPHRNTKIFHCLRVYQRTGDGKVALWFTASGNTGVLKIRLNDGSIGDQK
jgi:hypothetical protein